MLWKVRSMCHILDVRLSPVIKSAKPLKDNGTVGKSIQCVTALFKVCLSPIQEKRPSERRHECSGVLLPLTQ